MRVDWIVPTRRSIATVVALGLLLGLGATRSVAARQAQGPTLASAKIVAKAYATKRFEIAGLSALAFRSRRDPSVALVDGYYARPKVKGAPNVWAVYLRARNGTWRVLFAGINSHTAPSKAMVPCDIWPPFSEPDC
jgi:hypothetical protein